MSEGTRTAVNRQDLQDQREVLRLFRMKPREDVVPWLEKNIVLPYKMAPNSHGPFRTKGRPYQRWILECWNPDRGINHCGTSAGTQMLKTTTMVLGQIYRIANHPMPALLVGSSKDWTKEEIGEKRLIELINSNPILEQHKPADPNKFRDMSMDMSGGFIKLVGGNSPGALSGGSYGIVAIDEASKLIHQGSEQAPEAHPFLLAAKRTDGFGPLAFHWRSSTPNSPLHPFWQFILEGDQTHAYVECPHCKNWFFMDHMGRAEDREEYAARLGISLPKDYCSLRWDKDARKAGGDWIEEKVMASVRFICPFNGCEITETERRPMVEGCEPKRHNEFAAKNRKSFILPSFYSPTMSLGMMAWAFLQAQKDLFGLQDYYNSRLARPWTEVAANVKHEDVRQLRTPDYVRGEITGDPDRLYLGADVGDYATHWVVGAVYKNEEVAIVDWGTVLNPEDLVKLRSLKYRIRGTDRYKSPSRGLVDAADQTIRVYNMCQGSGNGGAPFWFPCTGSDSRMGSWGKQWLETYQMDRYTFNSYGLKKYFYVGLIKQLRAPRLYLPVDADESLIDGLSGQQLIVEKGEEEFKKLPNDHYGDACLRVIVASYIRRADCGGGGPDM